MRSLGVAQLAILASLSLPAGLASAATVFTAAGDSDFAIAGNWDNGLPLDTNNGTISGGLTTDLASSYDGGYATITIGSAGTAGTWNINNGGTYTTQNGGDSDVRVGVGAGSVGTVNINSGGTLIVQGAGADLFIGDAAGGQGLVTVNAGGTLDANKAVEVINGTLSLAAAATAPDPKDEFVVDNNGILAFATDGATIPTVVGGSLLLELGSTSTLHMNLGGTYSIGDSWTLFTGISGFSGVAGGDGTGVFGTVTNPLSPSDEFTVYYGTGLAASDQLVVQLVPEPATALLGALGLLGLLCRRRWTSQ